jgi:hypothetical protein
MSRRKSLKKSQLTLLLLTLYFCLFNQNIFGQTDRMPLPNVETIVNKICGSSAEIIWANTYTTGKVAHIYLLMEGKYFTKPYLKKFFTCISREYADIVSLKITALSDREKLKIEINRLLHPPIHENPPPEVILDPNPEPINYYRAYYYRSRKESFEYSPDPTKGRMITYNFKKPSVPLIK